MGKTTAETKPQKRSIGDRLATHEQKQQAALISSALAKLQAGATLKRPEQRALRRYDAEQLETWGLRFMSEIPKSVYCDQTNITQKVALEQSRRFELVYHTGGKTVDGFQQLACWHAWASKHKHVITRALRAQKHDREAGFEEEDYDLWDTRRVRAIALLKEHDYEERQGRMQPIELVHDLLQEFFVLPMLRRIELLEKRGSPLAAEVADVIRQDIKEFEAAVDAVFEDANKNLPEIAPPNSTARTGETPATAE